MNFNNIFSDYRLSKTEGRLRLLEILHKTGCPLSVKEIESRMPVGINRTTIYRNLNSLSQKGIIQKILSGDSLKYKMNSVNGRKQIEDEHVHFQCKECNRVICMEHLKVKDYRLPEGYDKSENQFLIIGICKECNDHE